MIALIRNNLAETRLDAGDTESADSLSAEALELARRIKLRWIIRGASVVQALITLGDEAAWDHAWKAGAELRIDDALTLAQTALAAPHSSPWAVNPRP